MVIRTVDVFLLAVLAAAVVGGLRWVIGSVSEKPHMKGAVAVESMAPDYSPFDLVPAEANAASRIGFALNAGETLVGVTSAKLYPITGKRVTIEKWDDVATAHVSGGLDLRTWTEKRNPSGAYALLFGLWIDAAGTREFRVGWLKFDAADLRFSRIEVHPKAGRRCRLAVTSSAGQPIPGALVSLSPPVNQNGLVSVLLMSDEQGLCLISGLDEECWVAALPEGVGPDTSKTSVTIKPAATEAALVAALHGRWRFVDSAIDLALCGGSLRIAQVKGENGPATAWPVSAFVAPGTGTRRRFTWMLPETAHGTRPVPAVLAVRGYTPLTITDVSLPFTLRVTGRALTVQHALDGK